MRALAQREYRSQPRAVPCNGAQTSRDAQRRTFRHLTVRVASHRCACWRGSPMSNG